MAWHFRINFKNSLKGLNKTFRRKSATISESRKRFEKYRKTLRIIFDTIQNAKTMHYAASSENTTAPQFKIKITPQLKIIVY